MPALDEHLHYRLVDVSSIKELARRWFPKIYFNAPAKHGGHRALADIRESIQELKFYREVLFVAAPGPHAESVKETAARFVLAPAAETPTERPVAACMIPPPRHSRGSRGGCSSVGRAPGCGPGGRGFKSRHSPHARPVRVTARRPRRR